MRYLRIFIILFLSALPLVCGPSRPLLAAVPDAPKIFADNMANTALHGIDRNASGRASIVAPSQMNPMLQITRIEMNWPQGNPFGMARHLSGQTAAQTSVTQKSDGSLFALRNKIKGAGGEAVADGLYRRGGWEQLDSKIGVQGLDGLYVRRTEKGTIKNVLITESKTGGAQLGNTKAGRQMSKEYILKNLGRLRQKIDEELRTARNSGDGTKEEVAVAKIKDIEAIERHVQNDNVRVRPKLNRTSVVEINGKAMLKVETSRLNHDGIPETDVNVGKPRKQFLIDLSKNPRVLTVTERGALNNWLGGMKQEMLNSGFSKRQANGTIAEIKKGIRTLDSGERGFNNLLANALRNNGSTDPTVVSNVAKAAAVTPGRFARALSWGRARGSGVAIGGALAAIVELRTTGRVTFANSGRELLLGGGSEILEIGVAKGTEQLAKRQLAKSAGKNLLGKAFKPASLGRYGGAVVVVATSVGFAIYEYSQGNTSGAQAAGMAAEGVAVGAVAIGAAQAGAAGCAATVAGALVAPVYGVVAATVVSVGYGVAKALYLDKKMLAMQRIDDEQQEARKKMLAKLDRERLETESKELFAKAGNFLAATKARY